MGAKLKSKTHLQNIFFEPFFTRLASKFWKKANMTQKIFCAKNLKRYKKRRISRWFQIPWKNCKKIHQEKVISKTSLTNMSKSEKRAYSHHVFANNFFWFIFSKFFHSKSAWNSAFFDIEFCYNKFFLLFSTFCKLWLHMRRKWKIFFYEFVLECY